MSILTRNETNSILSLHRLKTNCAIRGRSGGTWYGDVLIDSGSPITVIDLKILGNMKEQPTGEYFPGVGGGVTVPAGNNVFQVYLKTDVSAEALTTVYGSLDPFSEAQILLGLDWLQAADPEVDWKTGQVLPHNGKQVPDGSSEVCVIRSPAARSYKANGKLSLGVILTIALVLTTFL